jgi:1-acyl-sn-glycerol-3-phosphate acyltransferase
MLKKANNIINSKCSCGVGLTWKKIPHVILNPCNHILHKICINNIHKCPLCHTNINLIESIEDLQKKSMNNNHSYQKFVDMVCVSNFDHYSKINNDLLVPNIINLIGIMSKTPFLSGYTDGIRACKELLCIMNAKIMVNGLENITKQPKVYISTHTSYIDFIVIIYILKCGFLSSSLIKESWYGRLIMNIIPLLLIKRGKKRSNTVEKIKKYVDRYGSICLFPEGMITHPDTIAKFRTGAFYVGHPIVPIVIKYNPVIYDIDYHTFLKKISSCDQITITVNILPQELPNMTKLPPFSTKRIEEIRQKMAKVGNLALSNVSNKDICDSN